MINIKAYFLTHLRDCKLSLGDIFRTKLNSFFIILVVGLSLALPFSFLNVVTNIKNLGNTLDEAPQISLFLKKALTKDEENLLIKKIQNNSFANSITQIKYISNEDALKEFKEPLNLSEIINLLGENPLPHTLLLKLKTTPVSEKQLAGFIQFLKQLPEVDSLQLDLEWVKRLSSILIFAKQLATGFALLLALAVLLIIGNTLKLKIENQRENIEIASLVGASKAFIRRPFLYMGFWYGFLGSIVSIFIIFTFMTWLSDSLQILMSLYNKQGRLEGLDISNLPLLLLLGTVLGLGGAWLSVGRHIRNLQAH